MTRTHRLAFVPALGLLAPLAPAGDDKSPKPDLIVSEAFTDGFRRIERILRYTAFAWAYLERGDDWKEVFEQVVSSARELLSSR